MGCFIGCFGGDKDHKRRKQRIHRTSPQRQRNKFQNVGCESNVASEQSTKETITTPLIPEFQTEPEAVEQQPSPSIKKRVTFNSNVTTYEHVSVHGSVDSLPECTIDEGNQENSKTAISAEGNSIASYPSNHRYHNADRDSDDEIGEYGDSDLDDFDEEEDDGDGDYDYEDEYVEDVWYESVLTLSEDPSRQDLTDNVESPMMPGLKVNARDRSDYINSVLNPVENVTQWKALKSKGVKNVSKPQKENSSAAANFEPPCASLSSEPTFRKKSDQSKNTNQEIAVDASLSNWLGSNEVTPSQKSGSEGCASARSFEDRPILGALTVVELRQFSASDSKSPKKSPSRSPDETPIIGSVGAYWNHSSLKNNADSASSVKCIPNTTSKCRGIY